MKNFISKLIYLFVFIFFTTQLHAQQTSDYSVSDLGDVQLRYELTGSGEPLVLIHGWTHSLQSWELQMPDLENHHRVLRYDRRGFGESSGYSDISIDPQDLANLLDRLEIPSAHILGHSQGADAALRFAMAYPDKVDRLILYGCGPPEGFGIPWTGPDAPPGNAPKIAREHGLDSLGTVLFSSTLAKGFVQGSPGAEIASEMWEAYDGQDLLDPRPPSNTIPPVKSVQLNKIDAPTLVLTGEWEMSYFMLVADALDYAIPNSERVIIKGGGHAVHLQQPERFTGEVLRFLSK